MKLYAVIKSTGEYVGIPCISYDEAREVASCWDDSYICELVVHPEEQVWTHEKTLDEVENNY